jgi:hypothetical protein
MRAASTSAGTHAGSGVRHAASMACRMALRAAAGRAAAAASGTAPWALEGMSSGTAGHSWAVRTPRRAGVLQAVAGAGGSSAGSTEFFVKNRS